MFLLLGFDNSSLLVSVKERNTPNPVTLQVIRKFGLRGGSRVHWKAQLNGVLASDDVEPVEGDLVFADGESSKDIVFNVKPDATPEILEVSVQFWSCITIKMTFNLKRVAFPAKKLVLQYDNHLALGDYSKI